MYVLANALANEIESLIFSCVMCLMSCCLLQLVAVAYCGAATFVIGKRCHKCNKDIQLLQCGKEECL